MYIYTEDEDCSKYIYHKAMTVQNEDVKLMTCIPPQLFTLSHLIYKAR